jgi:hypothetical protein
MSALSKDEPCLSPLKCGAHHYKKYFCKRLLQNFKTVAEIEVYVCRQIKEGVLAMKTARGIILDISAARRSV